MHSSENFICFSSAISRLVAVFQSLSFLDELGNLVLDQAVGKHTPSLNDTLSMHSVRHNWQRPSLLKFNSSIIIKIESGGQ